MPQKYEKLIVPFSHTTKAHLQTSVRGCSAVTTTDEPQEGAGGLMSDLFTENLN